MNRLCFSQFLNNKKTEQRIKSKHQRTISYIEITLNLRKGLRRIQDSKTHRSSQEILEVKIIEIEKLREKS